MIQNRKLKIYFASSSKFIDKVKELAVMIDVAIGPIEVTRAWWKYHHEDNELFENYTDEHYYAHPQVQLIRHYDKIAIREADIVIVYNEYRYKLTGATWEMGFAEGVGTPVIVLGDLKRSTMYSGAIFARSLDELIEALKRWIN